MILIEKLSERSTWTGAGKVLLSIAVLYGAPIACAAPADVMSMTVGDVLGLVGLPQAAGVLGLLLGGYDIVRKEATPQ